MEHVIAYEGKVKVALGLMQEEYVSLYLPWVNFRIGVEGTLFRPPYSHAGGVGWVNDLDQSKGKEEVLAVLLRTIENEDKSYQYVGHMGIHGIQWPHGFAMAGSIIGPEFQGRGIGTEAMLLILYHAFMTLGLRKVDATVKAFNAQSMGHLMRSGYSPVGRYRKHYLHEGEFVDEAIFEVFREDWEPIWKTYQKTQELPKLTSAQRARIKKETRS